MFLSSPDDEPSSMATALQLVSRVITISVEMIVPGVGGHWLDRRWGTMPWLTMVGFALGVVIGLWHLIQLSRNEEGTNKGPIRDEKQSSEKD